MAVEGTWSIGEAKPEVRRNCGDVRPVAVTVRRESDLLLLAEGTEGMREGQVRVCDNGEGDPATPEVFDRGVHCSRQAKPWGPQDESTRSNRKISHNAVVANDIDGHFVMGCYDVRCHIPRELFANAIAKDAAQAHLCAHEGLDRNDEGAHSSKFMDGARPVRLTRWALPCPRQIRSVQKRAQVRLFKHKMPDSVAGHGCRGFLAGACNADAMTKISVLGAGSWGTTVASLLSMRTPTILWARSASVADELSADHTNTAYLGTYRLPDELHATSSLAEALDGASLVVLAVPSHGVRAVLQASAHMIAEGVPVLSLSKGLEENTLYRMTEVVRECWPGRPLGVLTGPNLASEVLDGMPTASVIAMTDGEIGRDLQELFSSETLRIYTNPDVIGCEIAGAVKNVMAIASGMAIGLGLGDNTRAALITRSLAEITRLGVALGGEPLTFAGLAGVGDLVATCTSTRSRNFALGVALGRGTSLADALGGTRMVAEGVKSCRPIVALANRVGVEVPVSEQVVAVCYGDRAPAQTIPWLMGRAAKSEMHGLVPN